MMKLEPHNMDAEMAVIGSLLIDRDAILVTATNLKPEDFFIARHQLIYRAVKDLYWQRVPTDIVNVVSHLSKQGKIDDAGGEVYLAELIAATPTSVHVEYYAQQVLECSTRRSLIRAAERTVKYAYDESSPLQDAISGAEEALGSAVRGYDSEAITTMDALADRYLAGLRREVEPPIFFGMRGLDDLVAGIRGGNLTVIASRPAVGKSALMGSIARYNVLEQGKSVLLVSLEMSGEEILHRILAQMTGIDNRKIANGKALSEGERIAVTRALDALRAVPLYIYSRSTGQIEDVIAKVRDCHARNSLDLVIVDYLQLLSSSKYKDNRVAEVSQVSRSLKVLAMELDIPVIALAQLNRASIGAEDKVPELHHLRESGSIEQDANQVIFIHKPDANVQVAKMIVAKQRNGPTGQVTMRYNETTTQFYESESEIVRKNYEYEGVPF